MLEHLNFFLFIGILGIPVCSSTMGKQVTLTISQNIAFSQY